MPQVIVADDDVDMREIYRTFLHEIQPGIEVTLVSNGHALVQEVDQGNYQVGFVDNAMPGLKGLEAIRMLRERGNTTPLYLVSGDDDRVMEKALQAGATGVIKKGTATTFEELERIVGKYFS